MSGQLGLPQKQTYLYVDFSYGATPTHVKYTDWPNATDVTFTYEPKLGVTIAANTGTFEDKFTTIELPYGDAFTSLVASGDPIPPVNVTITERFVDPLGLQAAENYVLFVGRVAKVLRNYQGHTGGVVLHAVSMKANLQVPLGLPCTQQCAWTFGGAGCEKSLTALKQNGTCTVIGNDRNVTITGLPAAPDASYWRQGYVTRDALSIVIRDWNSAAPTTFLMRDRPPANWIGQVVVVTPGCDKDLLTCRNRWANEGQFGGFGIAMPDYHPIIEG